MKILRVLSQVSLFHKSDEYDYFIIQKNVVKRLKNRLFQVTILIRFLICTNLLQESRCGSTILTNHNYKLKFIKINLTGLKQFSHLLIISFSSFLHSPNPYCSSPPPPPFMGGGGGGRIAPGGGGTPYSEGGVRPLPPTGSGRGFMLSYIGSWGFGKFCYFHFELICVIRHRGSKG